MHITGSEPAQPPYKTIDHSSPLEEQPPDTLKSPGLLSSIKDTFYKHSIFFALDNDGIAKELEKQKLLSVFEKFSLGLGEGIKEAVPVFALLRLLQPRATGAPVALSMYDLIEVVAAAIVEEIIFRGGLQNGIARLQGIATYLSPQSWRNTRLFQWLTSPSARIVSINSLFAIAHFAHGGPKLSTTLSLFQTMRIMLLSTESNLHETTGSIIAPIGEHVANNVCVHFLSQFV